MLPVLLNALESESDESASHALDGLREVMAVKSNVALPFLIPKLTQEPLTAQNAHALKALAEVSGEVSKKASCTFRCSLVLRCCLEVALGMAD